MFGIEVLTLSKEQTLNWEYQPFNTNTHIKINKIKRNVFVTGHRDDKKLNKKIRLPHRNWFQNPQFSLRQFAISPEKSTRFSIIEPRTLMAMEMIARKVKEEVITLTTEVEINGKKEINKVEYNATQIKISPKVRLKKKKSLLAALAPKVNLWFDTKTGKLLSGKINLDAKSAVDIKYYKTILPKGDVEISIKDNNLSINYQKEAQKEVKKKVKKNKK